MNPSLLGLPEGLLGQGFPPTRQKLSGIGSALYGLPQRFADSRYRAAIIEEEPALYWPMGEKYPFQFQDISGNGNHSTVRGRSAFIADNWGPIDGYGSVGDASRPSPIADFDPGITVEFWINPPVALGASEWRLFSDKDGFTGGFDIHIQASTGGLYVRPQPEDADTIVSTTKLKRGQWTCVAFVLRGRVWEYYFDGERDSALDIFQGRYPFSVGTRLVAVNQTPSNVLMAHVAYYGRSLDQATLRFHSELGRKPWAKRAKTTRQAPVTPEFKSELAEGASITDNVLAWSADAVEPDDILFLYVESASEAVAAPTGWTEVTNSPQQPAAATTRLTVFWKRSDGTETGVTVVDPGDHTFAFVHAYSGCVASGNPWDVTTGGVENVLDSSVSIPGGTTTVDNCLVVIACCTERDAENEAQFYDWANPELYELTVRSNGITSLGNGGGVCVVTGKTSGAGAYGTTTASTTQTTRKGFMTIALKSA